VIPHLILGVDPGITGAMALYDPNKNELVSIIDMPVHTVQVNSVARKLQDVWAISRYLDVNAAAIRLAMIEEPHAMPKQGVSSSFSFGRSLGEIVGAVAANFIRMQFVRPAKWKREMGLTHDKEHSRRAASARWPKAAELFARGKDDGRAEAALLALYGAQFK